MNRRAALPAWLVLSLAGIFSTTVSAYVLHDYKWPFAATTFNVDIPLGFGTGDDDLWNRAFEAAMDRWNDATVFEFRIRHTYEDPCDAPDGVNGVDFAWDICGDAWGGRGLAVTRAWAYGTEQTEANIIFNNEYSWDVYDGPYRGGQYGFGVHDFRRVAVHELGHALGLGHEESARSIMAPRTPPDSTIMRPQADDIAGVAALYGETETPPVDPPPPNDNFSDATRISGPSGRTTGSNRNATVETGEPGETRNRSVWWRWQAPSSGTATIDTVGSSFDTILGVYTGTQVDALITIAENDDAVGLQSRVTLDVTARTVYRLWVAGYASTQGNIVLNWDLEISEPPEPPEPDRHQYIFPQFAFGGGWESTLMVQSFGNGADCTFSAQDRFLTIREHFGNLISGTSMRMPLGAYQWAILKTETPPGMAASSGMAILDCDDEVSANTLFSLRVEGSLVARAVVEPAEEIRPGGFAQFLADHRDGSRFGVAVANLSSQPITVVVPVTDVNGQEISTLPVDVPANAAQAFFVDELGVIPADHVGRVWILQEQASLATGSVYVQGLLVSDEGVITTIPAIVFSP